MKKSEFTKGRINQKLQTRLEILHAAKALMKEKKKITLEDVAREAGISRATIYRYFTNMDLLFMEASLDIQHKSPDQIVNEVKDLSFHDRIFHIQEHYNKLAERHEIVFRRYLSAVLTESIVSKEQLRGARRVKTLNKALAPYKGKIPEETFNNLINISSILMGIDSLVICKDVCNLDNNETDKLLKWALETILKGISLKDRS